MYEKLIPCFRSCYKLIIPLKKCNTQTLPRLISYNTYHLFTALNPVKVNSDIENLKSCQSITTRNYAKSKDKKKESKHKAVRVDESELRDHFNVDKLYAEYKKPVDVLKKEYVEQLVIRSSAAAVDSLKVTLEGKEYLLQDLAEIGKKNPKTYVLDVSVFPQAIPAITAAILNSGLGINPQQDGTKLFLPIPKVTREHRETLAKNAKALFVKAKDSIRNVQNKQIDRVKDKVSDADEAFRLTEQLKSLGDKYINEAEEIMKTKQAELLKTDL